MSTDCDAGRTDRPQRPIAGQVEVIVEKAARLQTAVSELPDAYQDPVEQALDELMQTVHELVSSRPARGQEQLHGAPAVEQGKIENLRAVLEAVNELVGNTDDDDFYRRAIELPREKLNLERTAIQLKEDDELRGTFGTNVRGQTTDERAWRQPVWLEMQEKLAHTDPHEIRWFTIEVVFSNWEGDHMGKLDRMGWVAITPICSSSEVIGFFLNDTAISGAPVDPVQQEALHVYCSLLGTLIERMRAERALVEANRQHRLLFETMSQGVLYYDADGNLIAANPKAEEFLDSELEEMVGKNYLDLSWHLISRGGATLSLEEYPSRQALATGEAIRQQTLGMVRPNGNVHWFSVDAIPQFRPGEERPYQVYTSFEDITAKVEFEDSLRLSKQRYQELYERTQATLVKTEALYRASQSLIASARLPEILKALANSAATAVLADNIIVIILDLESREIDYVVQDGLHPSLRAETPFTFEELWEGLTGWVVRNGEPAISPNGERDPRESDRVWQTRERYSGPGGGSVVVVPICYQDQILGTLTASNRAERRDFNEDDVELLVAMANQTAMAIENARLQSETEERAIVLAKQAEELARSNADLEQFAYVASHDLQEPLEMVDSYIELFRQRFGKYIPAAGEEYLAHVRRGIARLEQLIRDLLAYSRIGTQEQRATATDSGAVLARVIDGMEPLIRETETTITAERLPLVQADEVQLAQVFQNLLSNAIKFRGTRSPQIHISAKSTEAGWLFSVHDNGIGIPSKQTQRIFNIFQRLHSRDQYPGTGIGLAICKKIVEGHGGRIWVDSQPAKGSTFYFTLPEAVDQGPDEE